MKCCLIPFQFSHVPFFVSSGNNVFRGHKIGIFRKNELKTKYNNKYNNMFRFVVFQSNSFIVTFLYCMLTIWKRFLQTDLNHLPEVFL